MDKLKSSRRPPAFWIGLSLIGLLLIVASVWLFWPQKSVLFSGLSSEDAAQITTQLDKQKIPYSLNAEGDTIYMAPDLIPKARLQVFSDNLSLKSGVGLELFSGNDLGMTEFSQHVNYVRALQGELTRTLLSIDGVESARVHIAMPEGSSRRAQAMPIKVAITINSKEPIAGQTVKGVQRFVTAAVPGVRAGDVVILDGKGNLLTSSLARSNADDGSAGGGSQLEQKAAIEAYLEKKAAKLLQSIAAPPARAEVIIDVSLSESQRHITREELIPSGQLRGIPVGLLQRGHFNKRPAAPQNLTKSADGTDAVLPEPSVEDQYEFANGKQIEQINNPIGAVERISVSVVIVGSLPLQAEEALQRSLSRGLGLNPKRGDDIAVLIMPALAQVAAVSPSVQEDISTLPSAALADRHQSFANAGTNTKLVIAAITGVVFLALLIFIVLSRKTRSDPEVLAGELRELLSESSSRTV